MAWRLGRSASVSAVVCPNGNPGIARVAEAPRVMLDSWQDWAVYAAEGRFDLVAVGPEAPLEAGLADLLHARGIPVFGPPQAGARLESSKAFCKEVLIAAGVPTARAESFEDAARAQDFAKSLGLPVVIKADGLAAGKGVTVATTVAEAAQAIDENLIGRRFGASSARVLVEEFMDGVEASVFGLCDGNTVVPMVAAQDHKRALDGDQGPNTGGMGAYAPTPFVDAAMLETIRRVVLEPTVAELRRRGIDYRGVLYAGIMLTATGPRVVEYNCRLGDPETQVVLPLLDGDFGEILLACAEGRLAGTNVGTLPLHATTVVMASGGYPGDYKTGLPITGLDAWHDATNEIVFHAGTALDGGGRVVTAGGRVLACTAWDTTLARAAERAYRVAESIKFEGRHLRRDIAARALHREG